MVCRARTVRQIADGNPRRYIQIMNYLFDSATRTVLDEKEQHRALRKFADNIFQTTQGLPGHGPLLASILELVGSMLAARIHGEVMTDGGSGFHVSDELLTYDLVAKAMNLGIDYTLIIPAEMGGGPLTVATDLRLSYVLSVHFWLPMRDGDRPKVGVRNVSKQLSMFHDNLTVPASRQMVQQLTIEMFRK